MPKNLLEKMPSASNSPLIGRKSIPTIPLPSSNLTECDVAGTSTESTEQLVSQKNRLPLSVASMVRRFERDSSSKSRAGSSRTTTRTAADIAVKHPQVNTPLSSRTSSLSSSQGILNALPSEQGGEEHIVSKDKDNKGKDNSRKSQIHPSKVDNRHSVSVSSKEQKSGKEQEANVNEAVIRDNNDNSCHMKGSIVQGDNNSDTKVGGSGGTSKKTPITMTSVVRAATATKDHQNAKEHKTALTAKRRATAPTTSTSAAVKASRSNITNNTSRNRSTTKAETSTTSSTTTPSHSDGGSHLEQQVSSSTASSKKHNKNSPVRT